MIFHRNVKEIHTFSANSALMNPLLGCVFCFLMCVEVEPSLKLESTHFTEEFLDFLHFLHVSLHVLLQVVLEKRSVGTKIAVKVFDVHVNFEDVPSHVTYHRSTMSAFLLRFRVHLPVAHLEVVDRTKVDYKTTSSRRFISTNITSELILLKMNHCDVLFNRISLQQLVAFWTLNPKKN